MTGRFRCRASFAALELDLTRAVLVETLKPRQHRRHHARNDASLPRHCVHSIALALNTLLYSIALQHSSETRLGAARVRLVVLGEELVGRRLEHLGRRRTLRKSDRSHADNRRALIFIVCSVSAERPKHTTDRREQTVLDRERLRPERELLAPLEAAWRFSAESESPTHGDPACWRWHRTP